MWRSGVWLSRMLLLRSRRGGSEEAPAVPAPQPVPRLGTGSEVGQVLDTG